MKPVQAVTKALAPAIVMASLLSACASQPPKSVQTVSGWPEIEIAADKKAVKDHFMLKNVEGGFQVENESDSSLYQR